MSRGPMIFLTGRTGWHWCLGACLAGAILFVSGCAKVAVPNVEGLTQGAATTAIAGAKLKVGALTQQTSNTVTEQQHGGYRQNNYPVPAEREFRRGRFSSAAVDFLRATDGGRA
jgi:hypothetical protein